MQLVVVKQLVTLLEAEVRRAEGMVRKLVAVVPQKLGEEAVE